jgi:hypothetical protein
MAFRGDGTFATGEPRCERHWMIRDGRLLIAVKDADAKGWRPAACSLGPAEPPAAESLPILAEALSDPDLRHWNKRPEIPILKCVETSRLL